MQPPDFLRPLHRLMAAEAQRLAAGPSDATLPDAHISGPLCLPVKICYNGGKFVANRFEGCFAPGLPYGRDAAHA